MAKMKKSWRHLYVGILNEGPRPPDSLSDHDRNLQRRMVCELIDSGYVSGSSHRDADGNAMGYHMGGPTVEGRLLADKLEEDLKKDTWAYRLKVAGVAAGGWVGGIASAWIVWKLTQ